MSAAFPGRARGFSLVELMVAAAISLVLVAALTTLFTNMSSSNRELAKTYSQIENARFAMQFLENDLVHAGYWGGFIPTFDDLAFQDPITDDPSSWPPSTNPDYRDPCRPFANWGTLAGYTDFMLGVPLQVYRNDLSDIDDCTFITNRVADTDVLVVRHLETCVPGDANCDADNANRLYMQVSNCEDEIDVGDAYVLANDPNEFVLRELDCAPPSGGTTAAKRRFVQNIYYIQDLDPNGPLEPALVRSRFDFLPSGTLEQQTPEVLVEGIERFRVELGLDGESETGDA
ncbi:MAG: prepilin-type N-terminal cleavage/methylation domain-containing protein, partial [Halioglobus sp.]|nr:prepilin-type N-terminal cleavage/methylation domain-containing protein [Halioglobus sp.]